LKDGPVHSVIVLDNASYHNIKTEDTVVPNFNQRKAVLQDYLSKHNIPFQPLETKKQLYEKPVHFLVIIPIFSFGKKNQITPINQTLLTITSVQNYQPFTFS
jgi:hypothetical protein